MWPQDGLVAERTVMCPQDLLVAERTVMCPQDGLVAERTVMCPQDGLVCGTHCNVSTGRTGCGSYCHVSAVIPAACCQPGRQNPVPHETEDDANSRDGDSHRLGSLNILPCKRDKVSWA
jgi:hypothetical protein